ncbi:GNAT family N-acetyltransferase [Clostridium gasigenes]|uniref:GNAT family N-acetyltransferase n=1 Tax=Clostridium gasigenes TaxID=94869 RepID=UPI001C0BD28E|nr:GNAT family N-acetyltransferase [Clostridium gasigenes]MBU3104977.1 GNAT family N-acetyltransferase [Clostridium gasigenes]
MDIRVENDCSNIDWNHIKEILKAAGMSYFDEDTHKKAFENSYSTVFIYDGNELIGFGRSISDGVYQAAIYDVAVLPSYQGSGIGRIIINNILESIPQCNTILYASPGKESFYNKLNFKKMKTGMAYFQNAEKMYEKGFIEKV